MKLSKEQIRSMELQREVGFWKGLSEGLLVYAPQEVQERVKPLIEKGYVKEAKKG